MHKLKLEQWHFVDYHKRNNFGNCMEPGFEKLMIVSAYLA